jgi:hypothetical protein
MPFLLHQIDDHRNSALSLSDPLGIEGLNFATLVPGTPFSGVLTRGSTTDKINNFVNLSDFVPGGLCVDDQGNNLGLPVLVNGQPNPGCASGLAAVGNVGRCEEINRMSARSKKQSIRNYRASA